MRLTAAHCQGHCVTSAVVAPSRMSLPSMRHLFLFVGTFHSLCLLLLKGHLKCRAFISCSERMHFPWMLSAKCLSHSLISKGMDYFFTCLVCESISLPSPCSLHLPFPFCLPPPLSSHLILLLCPTFSLRGMMEGYIFFYFFFFFR